MEIIIDCRETILIETCKNIINKEIKFSNIQIKTENMVLGDIIIKNKNVECFIIERKTIKDLLASIKDGRYNDQSLRLNKSSFHNHNIFYLVEGSDSFLTNNKQEKQTYYSSIFSLCSFKGFSIIRSYNVEETAYILCNMVFKLNLEENQGKKRFYLNFHEIVDFEKETNNTETSTLQKNLNDNDDNINNENKNTNCYVKKLKKNENINEENIGIILLCQIPNINNTTACEIMKHFNSFGELVEKIKLVSNTNKDYTFLYNIKYTTDKNKERKISKTAVENIIKFLN